MFLLFFTLFKEQKEKGCSPCFRPNLFFFMAGFRLHGFFHSSVQTDVLLWCGATVIHWSLHELFPFFFAFYSLSSPYASFIFPFMGMKWGRLSLLRFERTQQLLIISFSTQPITETSKFSLPQFFQQPNKTIPKKNIEKKNNWNKKKKRKKNK